MKFLSGRRIFSIFLGLLLAGAMVPIAARAQSSSQSPSTPPSTDNTTTTTTKKKSTTTKKAKATDPTAAAPTITQTTVGGADSRSSTATRSSANSRSANGSVPTVWVNTDTKTYHTEGSKYYGKTKHGRFMSEEDAKKAGYKRASN